MENNQQGSPCSCKSLTWKWSSCGMLNMIFKPLHNLQQAVFILVLVSVTSTHFQSTELDNYNCYPVWGACTLMHFAASACDAHTFKMLLSQVWTGYAGISINQQHLSDELYNYSVARWPLLKVSKWNKRAQEFSPACTKAAILNTFSRKQKQGKLSRWHASRKVLFFLNFFTLRRVYGVVPKGSLTFLGLLGNAEFSPWKRQLQMS